MTTQLDATFNVAQKSTAGVGFPDWNQVQENIVQRVTAGEKAFRISLKVFGQLLARGRGNNWVKASTPVPCQRVSAKRAYTDVIAPFYRAINPDTGRCWGYDPIMANMGNVFVVPLVDMKDTFGNVLKANRVYQADGNTGLVASSQIANGEVPIPKGYSLDEWLPADDEELDFEVIAISSIHQLDRYYETIDSTYSAKSKDDNYSSVLVGHNLVNYETGETDLVSWTTEGMDRPINLIVGGTVPKNIPNMNKVVSPLLHIIKSVREETSTLIKWSKSRKAIFKAFCLDITSLEQNGQINAIHTASFLEGVNKKINKLVDSTTLDYWEKRFFTKKLGRGDSMIETSQPNFVEYISGKTSSWKQLHFTIEDWVVWELFAIDREVFRDVQDHNLYGHGGSDILGGKDRKHAAYQSLNFLRILYLYAASINFKRRFSAEDAFAWATDNVSPKCSAVTDPEYIKILMDKKVREALKVKIYK